MIEVTITTTERKPIVYRGKEIFSPDLPPSERAWEAFWVAYAGTKDSYPYPLSEDSIKAILDGCVRIEFINGVKLDVIRGVEIIKKAVSQ